LFKPQSFNCLARSRSTFCVTRSNLNQANTDGLRKLSPLDLESSLSMSKV
jgi:hypothetical protein